MKTKYYYFEVEEEEGEEPEALALVRDKTSPELIIQPGGLWSAKIASKSDREREGERARRDSSEDESNFIGWMNLNKFGRQGELDWNVIFPKGKQISKDSLKRIQLTGALILYEDSGNNDDGTLTIASSSSPEEPKTFQQVFMQTGGNYFDETTVYQALRKFRDMPKDERAASIKNTTSALQAARGEGGELQLSIFHNFYAGGANVGNAVGSVAGLLVSACAAGLLGAVPLYLGNGLGFLAGGAIGSALSLTGLAASIPETVRQFIKLRREAGLSLAEKFYEKMRCYPSTMWKECQPRLEDKTKKAWLLVPSDLKVTCEEAYRQAKGIA